MKAHNYEIILYLFDNEIFNEEYVYNYIDSQDERHCRRNSGHILVMECVKRGLKIPLNVLTKSDYLFQDLNEDELDMVMANLITHYGEDEVTAYVQNIRDKLYVPIVCINHPDFVNTYMNTTTDELMESFINKTALSGKPGDYDPILELGWDDVLEYLQRERLNIKIIRNDS